MSKSVHPFGITAGAIRVKDRLVLKINKVIDKINRNILTMELNKFNPG